MNYLHHSPFFNDSNGQLFKELERIDLYLQHYTDKQRTSLDQHVLEDFLLDEAAILAHVNASKGTPHWMAPQRTCDVYAHHGERMSTGLLSQLIECFELTAFEVDIILLGLMAYFDSRYFSLFAALQRHEQKKNPSFELALKVFCSSQAQQHQQQACLLNHAPLLQHRLITLVSTGQSQKESWGQSLFQTSTEVFHFLTGNCTLSSLLAKSAIWHPVAQEVGDCPLSVLSGLQAQEAEQDNGCYPVLMLKGPLGSGRFSAIKSAAAKKNRLVLTLDIARLPTDYHEAKSSLIQAIRDARMHDAMLVIRHWDEFTDTAKEVFPDWLTLLQRAKVRVVGLCEQDSARFSMPDIPQISLAMPKLTLREKATLLSTALSTDTYASVDEDSICRRFYFNQESLPQILQEAKCYRSLRAPKTPVNQDDLNLAFRLFSQKNFGKLAQRVEPIRTFEDLIITDELKEQLQEVLIATRQRQRLLEAGFADKVNYGTGISTLFYGDSGTGKTMAAEVIAKQLNVDLIKVDLASVVDKYIGETEKHLARIFDLAEADAGVLFFDEADALFGKRSAVNDSKDRHANIEVAYLLQRLESHPGLVILSTNNRSHLDDAFSRRFTFITRFNFPDAAVRERMWRTIWPKNISLSPDINVKALAMGAELTGANIRNISVLSAWLAAEDGALHIGEHHIRKAMKRELAKIGRITL
ncbi:ATP-binding protein [Shewanella sp. YLB-07]|uniref:ATP-binding protein n=1 Tax=Shewanella sp. YLB-07 TaxID=2601268 RepID=UPI00128E91E9|nr:AAA family ATPase [Shewanella sp. YLB-07]MPY24376.1 ATP-binding protein [Shewanella sp. YLB-07]